MCEDWLDGYMIYTNNSEPPVLYNTWVGVSVIAGALRRKCYLPWGTITVFPNMYIVLVGPSGKCRKGTAMGFGYGFLNKLGVKMASEAITREALIRELSQCTDTISTTGTQHASLTIYSQELTVFLGYNNMQLMADLCDWYDCRESWTYRTKNMGTDSIQGVFVNLIGATTPELLQTTLPQDAIGGGLASRIVFVYEKRKAKVVAFPFLTKDQVELGLKLTNDLDKIAMMQGPFTITDDFIECWRDWYTASEANPPFDDYQFSGYIERRPTHLWKLSMIMSASRSNSMEITDGDFKRALSLLTLTEVKMPLTFGGFGKADNSVVMERIMSTIAAAKVIKKSELQRRFYRDIHKKEMELVIDTLQEMRFIKAPLYQGGETIIEVAEDISGL
jgi:hypothetical protein